MRLYSMEEEADFGLKVNSLRMSKRVGHKNPVMAVHPFLDFITYPLRSCDDRACAVWSQYDSHMDDIMLVHVYAPLLDLVLFRQGCCG